MLSRIVLLWSFLRSAEGTHLFQKQPAASISRSDIPWYHQGSKFWLQIVCCLFFRGSCWSLVTNPKGNVCLVIEYTVTVSSLQSFHGTAIYRPSTPRPQNGMSLGLVPLTRHASPVDFVMLGISTIHLRRSWSYSYSKYPASVTVRHPET